MVDAPGELACAVKLHNACHAFTCFCRSASHAKCAIRKPLAVNLGACSSGSAHRVGQWIRPIDFEPLRHAACLIEHLLQALHFRIALREAWFVGQAATPALADVG